MGVAEVKAVAELCFQVRVGKGEAGVASRDVAALTEGGAIGEGELQAGVGVVERRWAKGWRGGFGERYAAEEILGERALHGGVGKAVQADRAVEQAGGEDVLGA